MAATHTHTEREMRDERDERDERMEWNGGKVGSFGGIAVNNNNHNHNHNNNNNNTFPSFFSS